MLSLKSLIYDQNFSKKVTNAGHFLVRKVKDIFCKTLLWSKNKSVRNHLNYKFGKYFNARKNRSTVRFTRLHQKPKRFNRAWKRWKNSVEKFFHASLFKALNTMWNTADDENWKRRAHYFNFGTKNGKALRTLLFTIFGHRARSV